jgi:hypothetical protein
MSNYLWIGILVCAAVSAVIAYIFVKKINRNQIERDEELALYSNLITTSSILLGVLAFIMTAASGIVVNSCNGVANITSNSIELANCVNVVSKGLGAIYGILLLGLALLILLAILLRPFWASKEDRKTLKHWAVWALPVFITSFEILEIVLFIIILIKPA